MAADAWDVALDLTGVNDAAIQRALAKLRANDISDEILVAKLRKTAESLDEAYFDCREQYEAATSQDGEAFPRLFRQARAIAAVADAFGRDSFAAVTGSIYEAGAAIGDDKLDALWSRLI